MKVFLDANVVIRAGKPPGKPVMPRLEELVTGGLIKVVTTDLTKIEVAKKHANNEFEVIGDIARKRFRNLVKEAVGIELPKMSPEELHRKLHDKYMAGTELMFSRLQAKTLSIGDVKPMAVFEAYTHKTGLFRGEAKKDQFPDAFVFECLKAEATKDDPLVIVSDDGDFEGPSNDANYISHIKSISDLFTALGLTTDEVPDVGSFLEASYEEVIRAVDKELNGWGLQVSDVEDADIDESSVKNVEFLKFATFRAAGERQEILVIGRVKMEVNVSYTHPDWDGPMYDSEDKVLIPFDNVSGERD